MMTFLLFALASTKWLGWRKTQKIPKRPLTLIVQSYFDTPCVTCYQWHSVEQNVIKVMDQKTLVKNRWSYKVRITVYILTPSEFCQTRVHKSLIGNLARHSFSFFDRNKSRPHTSKTSEWFNGWLIYQKQNDGRLQKFDDHQILRWLIPCTQMSFRYISFKKIRLECASVNWSNVLLISKAYFPANKMNWM